MLLCFSFGIVLNISQVMDTDRSGSIDMHEFRAWMHSGDEALAKAAACAAVGRRMSVYGNKRDGRVV